MESPIICFGQQPSGFFPKRFLYAKIVTARKLQAEIGGRIVFFYHDSDADYRETITIMENLQTKEEGRLNFTQENKIQKKYSPLYKKRIPPGWKEEILRKLPQFVSKDMIEIFMQAEVENVADFCLDMYKKMPAGLSGGKLLDGIEIMRSGDKKIRESAEDLDAYYADVPYEGEIVRAEMHEGRLRLHEGGGKYLTIPTPDSIEKWQKSPGRDHRFAWMQSVIHATHYIAGAGESDYLKKEDFPGVTFVDREVIDRQDYAFLQNL